MITGISPSGDMLPDDHEPNTLHGWSLAALIEDLSYAAAADSAPPKTQPLAFGDWAEGIMRRAQAICREASGASGNAYDWAAQALTHAEDVLAFEDTDDAQGMADSTLRYGEGMLFAVVALIAALKRESPENYPPDANV